MYADDFCTTLKKILVPYVSWCNGSLMSSVCPNYTHMAHMKKRLLKRKEMSNKTTNLYLILNMFLVFIIKAFFLNL